MIMDLETLRSNYRNDILAITSRYGASDVFVFGSTARGTADDSSDIDLLVNLEESRSLMDLARINVALEDLLHKKVDIVVASSLKSALRDNILKDATRL